MVPTDLPDEPDPWPLHPAPHSMTDPAWLTHRRLALLLTLGIALWIGVGALSPPPLVPTMPVGDKALHIWGFVCLTMPMAVLWPRGLRWQAPAAIAYGGVIELLQPLVGRQRELADLGADSLGVLVGAGLGLTARWIVRRALAVRAQRRLQCRDRADST